MKDKDIEVLPLAFNDWEKDNFKTTICKSSGEEVYNFIAKYVNFCQEGCVILHTTNKFNIDILLDNKQQTIINLHKINDFMKINKFFKAVNTKLPLDGIFIGCVETNWAKKNKIYTRYPRFFSFFYFVAYFIFKRIFPKLLITRWFYFFLTKGKNRAISKAETFGRLVYCGFEIVDFFDFNNLKYFVVKKIKTPTYNGHPSFGIIFKMPRIGREGKLINVYKFRTMHPFSEYLQEYVYQINQLESGGKFKNDFRISTTGHFMRKFWIDELPMIWNFLKGEMKIIGVRPLSPHYFSLYSKELQERRIKFKPGLIPPFYVDRPGTLEEIMASEMKYFDLYEKNPFKTDVKYFFLFLKKFFLYKTRSK